MKDEIYLDQLFWNIKVHLCDLEGLLKQNCWAVHSEILIQLVYGRAIVAACLTTSRSWVHTLSTTELDIS